VDEDGRRETEDERSDRKWGDLLQEMRVMQTGTQLIAGFLLTLPFQGRFEDLDGYQRGLYLAVVLVALVTTALVISPIAVHRRLTGHHVKHRLVALADIAVRGVLAGIGLLIVGITVLVVDVVVGRAAGLLAGGVLLAIVVALLVLLPEWALRHVRPRVSARRDR
jgi:MFS family permease